MSDGNKDPIIADRDNDMPPAADMGAVRAKGGNKSKQNRYIIGGMVAMLGVGAFAFLRGPSEDQVRMPTGGATVEAEVEHGGGGGGEGRERAQVLSEIDEREAVQKRIESGHSAIQFGDPVKVDKKTPEKPAQEPVRPSVFGNVEPRERVADKTPREIQASYPLSGNKPLVRPVAGRGSVDKEAVQYELGLLAKPKEGDSDGMVYTAATASDGNKLPLTPALEKQLYGQSSAAAEKDSGPRWKAGALALPGDLAIAYLSNRISSDQPSAIVTVDILDGKMKGAKALGKATFEGERLLLNFDRIVYKGEVLSGIQAYAVDPNSFDTSLQSGIDRRLLTRYGVPLLMGIASIGIDYAGQKDSTTVYETDLDTGEQTARTVDSSDNFGSFALRESSDDIKQPFERIADSAANVKPEVWADPGVIGLLFNTSVPSVQK